MPIELTPRRYFVVVALVSLLCVDGNRLPVYAQAAQAPIVAAPLSGAAKKSISGIVRGPDNKPVVGATVAWYAFVFGSDDDPMPTSKTDANGRFVLSVANDLLKEVPNDAENKLLGGATVYAPGLGVASVTLERGSENAVVLPKPTGIRGKVSAKNVPLVNAQVLVTSLTPKNGSTIFIPPSIRPFFTTATDKNGAWQINNLPENSSIQALVSSKGWTSADLEMSTGPLGSEPKDGADVALSPAVPVSGRVVDSAGKPVSGVSVVAQGTRTREAGSAPSRYESNDGETKTDAMGRYSFDGLAPGVVMVRVSGKPDAPLVAVAQTGITLARGKPVTVPDLVMTPGGLIKGTLIDADTNLPVTGNAMIGGNGPQLPKPVNGGGTVFAVNVQPDGTFLLRTPPGKIELYIMGMPTGYLGSDDGEGRGEKTLTVLAGQTQTVTIAVRKGRTLNGMAVDEAGKPVGGVQVRLGAEWDEFTATSDAKGAFTISGLPRSAKKLPLTLDGNWASASPMETVELPASNAALPTPFTLHLKRVARKQITGRVLTPKGEPVEGATIRAMARVPLGGGSYTYTRREGTTDKSGTFTLDDIPVSPEVRLEGEKAGYRWLKGSLTGAPPSDAAPKAMASAVMTPLTLRAEGVVIGANGLPVAGATVFAPESAKGLAGQGLTDAKGHFALDGLPQDLPAQVAAYTKTEFGMGSRRSAGETGPLVVTLEPAQKPSSPSDLDAALDLLRGMQRGAGRLETLVAPYDPDRALALASPADKPAGEGRLGELFRTVAERRPDRIGDWVLPHLSLIKTESVRAERAAEFMVLTPPGALPVAVVQTGYRNLQFVVAQEQANGNPYRESSLYLTLATLAARLQKPAEANAHLTRAVSAAKRIAVDQQGGWWGAMAEAVAASGDGGVLVRNIVKQTPPADKVDVYSRAIPVVAQSSASAAIQLLTEMDALPGASQGNERFRVGSARLAVVRESAKTDPTLALRVAREISGEEKAEAIAYVAYFMPLKNATPVFAEAAEQCKMQSDNASGLALIAAMAYEKNPVQGAAFFRDARARLNTDENDLAHFAYYYARFAPAEARVLLEGAWASALSKGTESTGFEWESKSLAEAMMALDVERAKEMAQKIPDHQTGNDFNPRADTLRKIATYLAADAKTRRTTRLDNWEPSDTQRGPW